MAWWGKVLGGTFGMLSGGPLGAIFGAAVGHTLDVGLRKLGRGSAPRISASQQQRIQSAFFSTVFSVLGYIAKADGRVSESEISVAENLMSRMALSPAQRKAAIGLFNRGKRADFPMEDVLLQFRKESGVQRNLSLLLCEIFLQVVYADDVTLRQEQVLMERIAHLLGLSKFDYIRLVATVQAARAWRADHGSGRGAGRSRPFNVATDAPGGDDFAVLGLSNSASNDEVKRAYRRLMSQHHPDKLVAKGLPSELIQLANEKTHQIRTAYERVRQVRGF